MKFLWQHSNTRVALAKWAGTQRLIVANHFFWNAGSNAMQTSQIGLLRSLLFQVFRQYPELMKTLVLNEKSMSGSGLLSASDFEWGIQRLLAVFESLSDPRINSAKLCLFIDGLDEFDGNHYEIVQVFQKFSASSHVKICLSSRPWNVFRDAFGCGKNPSLMLEHLTKTDIQTYVNDKLGADYRFQALADTDSRYRDLIQEVVTKAEGVFLWVVLVVHSLLNGLADDNSIPDMQLRLSHFPSDLDKFFQHMMDSIEEIYKPQTAQILQMAIAARSPLPIFIQKYIEDEKVNPGYAVTQNFGAYSREHMIKRRKRLTKFLNARCKGLLEVHVEKDKTYNLEIDKTFTFVHKLGFLHRTVRDFLLLSRITARMKSQAPRGFDANTTLCRAHLALLKEIQPNERARWTQDSGIMDPANLRLVMCDIMHYAKVVEIEHDRSEWKVLDEVDRMYATQFEHEHKPSSHPHQDLDGWDEVVLVTLGSTYLIWTINAGLVRYVERRLMEDPSLMQNPGKYPLLHYALCPEVGGEDDPMNIESKMVRLLLRLGADPNEVPVKHSDSVWFTAVQNFKRKINSMTNEQKDEVFKVVIALLEAGADPWVLAQQKHPQYSSSWRHHLKVPDSKIFKLSNCWSYLSRTQVKSFTGNLLGWLMATSMVQIKSMLTD